MIFFLNYNNQWILVNIVVDYNNKNIKYYRNGILFYTYTTTNTMLFPSESIAKYEGTLNDIPNYPFLGYIDNIRIYNRALSADEASEIYNKTKSKYQ